MKNSLSAAKIYKKVDFGFGNGSRLSGAEIYIRAFQLASLLPLFYIIAATSYMKIISSRGLLARLFDLGISLLPRWEALGLSSLYRACGSEIAVYFLILGGALVFGLAAGKLLRNKKTARASRIVFACLIACDLVMRLFPMRFNTFYGLPLAIVSFIFRAACLLLIVLDLRSGSGA